MNDPLVLDLKQSGRDGEITLRVTAYSLADMKAALLVLEGGLYGLEDGLKKQADAAASEAAKYFPGEKFCHPKGKDYTINDSIKLTARTGDADAIRVLQRWGAWWKVRAATKAGAAWLLQSIAEQPREMQKKQIHELLMMKDLDQHFAVIGVLSYPTTFTYKLAETGVRINAS